MPGSDGSVPCQILPCRVLMIRAAPNISVPYRAIFLYSECSTAIDSRQMFHGKCFTANVHSKCSRQLLTANVHGEMFNRKRGNPYTLSRTRFSNGLAYSKSKVSVNTSQLDLFHTNFSPTSRFLRSIFPHMSNIYESG